MIKTAWHTCSPTRIRLVSAPSGNTAWTCGTSVLLSTPPSGPIRWLSCLMRDTTAKYCGKSRVMMRHIRLFSSSSGLSSSGVKITIISHNQDLQFVQYKISRQGRLWAWFKACIKLHHLGFIQVSVFKWWIIMFVW